jgi:hypothetical protein
VLPDFANAASITRASGHTRSGHNTITWQAVSVSPCCSQVNGDGCTHRLFCDKAELNTAAGPGVVFTATSCTSPSWPTTIKHDARRVCSQVYHPTGETIHAATM